MSGVVYQGPPPRSNAGAKAVLQEAEALLDAARTLRADHERARAEVHQALHPIRAGLAKGELARIPTSRLKDVTGGRLRLNSLEQAGRTNVLQILEAGPYGLQLLPGVGPQTASQAYAAAQQIARAVEETVTLRIDVERQHDPAMTALVVALHRLVAAGPQLPRTVELAASIEEALGPAVAAARPARSRLRMAFTGRARREEIWQAVERVEQVLAGARDTRTAFAQASADLLRPLASGIEAWTDFEHDSAAYYGLLVEIAGLEPDRATAEGHLPGEIADRVRAQPLDDTHCRVSLRGYQAFGARFVLAQRRVILGDEMGLGKTIEAIAVLAHLRAEGAGHFLVACPASVLINWLREVEARSTLRAVRVHGPERDGAFADWIARGGVAVTTIDALHTLRIPDDLPLGMLVVDEAHYVKNPQTRRSKAVAAWARRTDRVLFLTGTPMENRVSEFRNLVEHLQPDLAGRIEDGDGAAGPQVFRRAVAPAYLRRNQEDVLTELPDLVEVEEWESFSAQDMAAYREAVASGNFMAMRRAAFRDPAASAKLERLRELVAEAADNGHKVVIFSFFRDVLETVRQALGPAALGPITGSVTAARRQHLVDEFTAAPGHAVLLSQIQAGGVGLNLQAASVVIICEPQLKPTLEDQAVARAHRMGQVRKVQVHRLLVADSVDQRMLEILRRKSDLFDAYARRSDLAESAPEAFDISEQALARQIVEAEQRRLAGEAEIGEVS
ncbi:SNF2 family N-terminal domain-containing protein [Thermomonospora echinospora]|uniref:SNF2 family N-terminal domain-containing protein n=1 Tax=Thermomonospora echinospora TaxID=1992 RepID=A0A1H6C7J0_9ACTN|nr:DEAD/DEAH box helicase [Thermomonospora echinospora]SEG68934.1 SNF2 family N-terminal domain-containing protein [Thermomonospora echinospora]